MNVHQRVRQALNHKAAVTALLAAEPPPLPALHWLDSPGTTTPSIHCPKALAYIELHHQRPMLVLPARLPLSFVPTLIHWLQDIQADVPESNAFEVPDDNPDDYAHPEYNPTPGAD